MTNVARQTLFTRFILLRLVLPVVCVLTFSPSWAIVVTSTADGGPESLREAIQLANGDGVATTITFDPTVFPPEAPATIFITSVRLPNIEGEKDSIDGTGAGVIIESGLPEGPANTGIRVRASNVTIQGITIQGFLDADAVRVEARNATPIVTGVLITNNNLLNNGRGVRIDGGNQNDDTEVSADVIDNALQNNNRGITVRGNSGTSDGGNVVSVVIENNTVQAKDIEPFMGGDGIQVIAGTGAGSNNEVDATIMNNSLVDIPDDGVVGAGCGADDTGSHNIVDVTITGNDIKYKNDNSPDDFFNNGIVITGAGGESLATSECNDNDVTFNISDNVVTGFKNSNIHIITGDSVETQGNDLQGMISSNVLKDSLGRGINITAGAGDAHSIHDVTITGNQITGNVDDGLRIAGGSSTNVVITRITVVGNTLKHNDDGIFVAGSNSAQNATISDLVISGNTANNNGRHGISIAQGAPTNSVSLSSITNNTTKNNVRDGIGIRPDVDGAGATPVNGNRSDRNDEDGIQIASDGYSLSGNRADRNAGDGINAIGTGVGGNTDAGGNRARKNADCNEPLFCF